MTHHTDEAKIVQHFKEWQKLENETLSLAEDSTEEVKELIYKCDHGNHKARFRKA